MQKLSRIKRDIQVHLRIAAAVAIDFGDRSWQNYRLRLRRGNMQTFDDSRCEDTRLDRRRWRFLVSPNCLPEICEKLFDNRDIMAEKVRTSSPYYVTPASISQA